MKSSRKSSLSLEGIKHIAEILAIALGAIWVVSKFGYEERIAPLIDPPNIAVEIDAIKTDTFNGITSIEIDLSLLNNSQAKTYLLKPIVLVYGVFRSPEVKFDGDYNKILYPKAQAVLNGNQKGSLSLHYSKAEEVYLVGSALSTSDEYLVRGEQHKGTYTFFVPDKTYEYFKVYALVNATKRNPKEGVYKWTIAENGNADFTYDKKTIRKVKGFSTVRSFVTNQVEMK